MGRVFVVFFWSPGDQEATKGPHSGARACRPHTPHTPGARGVPRNTTRQQDRRPAGSTSAADERQRGRLPSQPTKRAREHDRATFEPPDSEAWRVREVRHGAGDKADAQRHEENYQRAASGRDHERTGKLGAALR